MELSKMENIKSWLGQLQNQWYRLRKCDYVSEILRRRFESVDNPFLDTMDVIQQCDDFMQVKQKSLCFTIIEEFGTWAESKRDEQLAHLLTAEVRLGALRVVVKQRNIALIKLVCQVYNVKASKHICIETIRELIEKKYYKEACQVAALLQLHEQFSIMDFLVPLIFQDKFNVVEEFLSDSVHHQRDLVAYLDSLLGKDNIRDEVAVVVSEYQIPDVKSSKLYYKPLCKLIKRLMDIYHIPHSICPNLSRKRSEGAIQFLVWKKYHDQSLGVESWREMVYETCGFSPASRRELISLVTPCDPEEGFFWAQEFEIPVSEWPPGLVQYEQDRKKETDEEPENWDNDCSQFHELSLLASQIIVVDCSDKFTKFIEEVSLVEILGMDCEWKPSFGLSKSDLSLLQIATKTTVYIIDVIGSVTLDESLWQEVNQKIFGNPKIIKLGFGMSSDMNIVSQSLPVMFQEKCGFLDLAHLWKSLKDVGFVFPCTLKGNMGESLSSLVQLCMGKPLDKSNQFSNWERRPLREGQLRYAALDAFCLIEVFEVLKEDSLKQGIPFYDICAELSARRDKSGKGKGKSRKRAKSKRQNLEVVCPFAAAIPASSFRVLCDGGLKGLGYELRKVGVDTIIPEDDSLPDHLVRQASVEQRVILIQRAAQSRYSQYVPSGYCYHVLSEGKVEQLREVISHFRVVIRRENIFSRCRLCNGASFNKISQGTLKMLRQPNFIPVLKDDNDDDDDEEDEYEFYNNYGGFLSDADDDIDEPGPPISAASHERSDCWVENVNITCQKTRLGRVIDSFSVPQECVENHNVFYVCEPCGKIYWEGSHLDRFINSLKDIVQE